MATQVEPLKPHTGNASLEIDNNDAAGAFLAHTHIMRRGASWFLWIGLLSVVNSVLMFADGGKFFVAGLGVNLVVDTVAKQMPNGGIVADIIVNGIVVLLFTLFWLQARKGAKWAFLVGMALYAADSFIFFAAQDWLAFGFHMFALWRIWTGFSAARALGIVVATAEQKLVTATASWSR
jgi:hypothetical protein